MKVMAARIAAEGGSRDISRFLWTEIYNSTQDPNIRRNALEHLLALRAEEDIEELQRLVGAFARHFGRPPHSIGEMVAAGLLPGLPTDPTGQPYVLAPDGGVHLNPSSKINVNLWQPLNQK
jgi:hypothetical protein